MICSTCAAVNGAGRSHCQACGAPLIVTSAPPAEGLSPGTHLAGGVYVIEAVLGRGGLGITYRAWDCQLERPVAIKEFFPHGATRSAEGVVPPPDWSAEEFAAAREQFLTEGRLLARFTRPGIAQVHFVFEERGTAYLALELVRGETLADRLHREGTLAPAEAIRIGLAVLDTLAAVHAAGIVHGDIKPENLLLASDGRVVLVDFGAAQVAAAGGRTGRWVSPAYAPLEQYARTAPLGPYTDLYALAATLYHAITGTPPPPATDRARGVRLRSPAELRPGIPSALASAIVAGLAMEVRHRPATAEEFRRALAAASPEERSAPVGESLARPATPYPGARRRPSGMRLLATLALLTFFVPLVHGVLFAPEGGPPVRAHFAMPGWLEVDPKEPVAWHPLRQIVARWCVHPGGSRRFPSPTRWRTCWLEAEWVLPDGRAIATPETRARAPEGAGWSLGDEETGDGVRVVEDRFHVPAWALAAALACGREEVQEMANRRAAAAPRTLLDSPPPARVLRYRARLVFDDASPLRDALPGAAEVTVTLPEASVIRRYVRECRDCYGGGTVTVGGATRACTGECRGARWLLRCFVCHGTGAIPSLTGAAERCDLCQGNGWVDDERLVLWERRGDTAFDDGDL